MVNINNLNIGNLNIGDVLKRNKNGIFSKHYGLVIGKNGNDIEIADNQNSFGVRYVSLEDFMDSEVLVDIVRNNFSIDEKNKIIEKVKVRIGRNYDLLKYNCEHFVNDVLFGKVYSKQIQNAFAIGLFGLFTIGAAIYYNKKRK